MKKIIFIACIFMAACGKKDDSGLSYEEMLKYNVGKAGTDIEKVTCLSRLAWYYMEVDKRRSDSIMQSAYSLSVQNGNEKKEALVLCYLFDAERHLLLDDYKSQLDTVTILAKEARNLANSYGWQSYEAYSFLYLAQAAAKAGVTKNIDDYFSRADNIVNNSKDDSLKLEYYCTRSQVYQGLRLLNNALQNASKGLEIAERTENRSFRIRAYRRLAHLYEDIDPVTSVGHYNKLLELCKGTSFHEDLIWSYISLARYYVSKPALSFEAMGYLDSAATLATGIRHESLVAQTKLEFVSYYIKSRHIDSAVNSMRNDSEAIQRYFVKSSLPGRFYYRFGYLRYSLAEYYRSIKDTAEADNNYRLAFDNFLKGQSGYYSNETDFKGSMFQYYYGTINYYLYYFNKEKANRYMEVNGSDYDTSYLQYMMYRLYSDADYYLYRAQQLHAQVGDPENLRNILSWREDLARDSANFYFEVFKKRKFTERKPVFDYSDKAWIIRKIYDSCDNVCQTYRNAKDQFKIEADRKVGLEEIKKERQERLENIKLVGIILALVTVFILLVASGYLRTSLSVIRGLNFFAFIFLFEFIILLSDKRLHEFTHGELLSSLLLKIALAAVLVPLHHFLEEKVIHIIAERNLAVKNL